MWTPKRLVLLFCGVTVFLTAYLGYAMSTLGGIDGLPPLPKIYMQGSHPVLGPVGPRGNNLEAKIRLAFGEDCPELTRPIRLDLHSKNMVLAADQFQIEPDGRVCLSPLSMAVFGKDKSEAKTPEINTVRSQTAFLKFDRPIANLSEVASRKLIGAEITGNIQIVNNRRTIGRDDDLCLFIGTGPLFYEESNHLVWTLDTIHLTDHSSKPKPIEVRGKGMELALQVDAPAQPVAPGRKAAKNEQISGLKKITLQSDVDMHLYVDAKSGFPGGTQAEPKPPAEKKPLAEPPAEKAHVTIKTPGRFTYELFKDHDRARFDVPEGQGPAGFPLDVTVTRYHERLGLIDQLVCQHLDMRVRRKEKKSDAAQVVDASPEKSLEIETAHATGPEVTLTSDAEKLEAHGNDFFYDAPKATTTLKGEPRMVAVKEGNTIRARELQIQDQKLPAQAGSPAKSFQQVTAIGPVTIELLDKASGIQKPVHASCNDKLISTKDGPHDLLILTGAARFTDDEHNQHLQADLLKVWLNPDEREPVEKADKPIKVAKDGKPAAKSNEPAPGRKPHHIEALGNVVAVSPEMNIHDTGRLVVWFKDVPVAMLPDAAEKAKPVESTEAQKLPGRPVTPDEPVGALRNDAIPPAAARAETPVPAKSNGVAKEPAKPQGGNQPIDLSARSVEAWVQRSGPKNQVEKLWTEGTVQVHQDPAKPDEKGIDVKGDTLEMTYHPEGNFLVVTGDLAQLRLDKIYILGPEVNIDQAANKAWVNGIGAMQMESATNFQGNKLERPLPLTVHWNKSMLFNGRFAEFHGGIQAEQDNARLAGQSLQVFFDRPISLKEGNKTDQAAKVQNLVCDRDVRVEEATYELGKLVRYQRIMTPVLVMSTLEREDDTPQGKEPGNEVRASGPGNVRILQQGEDPAAPPGQKPAGQKPTGPKPAASGATAGKPAGPATKAGSASAEQEMKMTYVQFLKSMYANSKTSTAIFLENVRVLHLPCDDPNLEIDLDVMLDKMPEGAMYLRCDRLDVYSRGEKGHAQQEMLAKGRCVVQAQMYWGRANTVTYNEAKDQLIFEGGDDGPAVLYKVERKGDKPQEIRANKIFYIRKTGEAKVDKGQSLEGR